MALADAWHAYCFYYFRTSGYLAKKGAAARLEGKACPRVWGEHGQLLGGENQPSRSFFRQCGNSDPLVQYFASPRPIVRSIVPPGRHATPPLNPITNHPSTYSTLAQGRPITSHLSLLTFRPFARLKTWWKLGIVSPLYRRLHLATTWIPLTSKYLR